jgi:hypothetical protein
MTCVEGVWCVDDGFRERPARSNDARHGMKARVEEKNAGPGPRAVAVGMILVAGGVIGVAGLANNLYLWGLIPARWVLIPGGVMGLSILGGVIWSVGLKRSAKSVDGWAVQHKRLWMGAFLVAVLIGAVGAWEEYGAPQEVIVMGLPDQPVEVKVEGEEPFSHVIDPGSRLEFAVPHGAHRITLRVGDEEVRHDLLHEGFRGDVVFIDPPR